MRHLVTLLVILGLMSCVANDDVPVPTDPSDSDTTDTEIEVQAAYSICESLGFDTDEPTPPSADIFRKFSGCQSCHRSNPTGLTFSNTHAQLVDEPSSQVPEMDRVEPFDVTNSYLWHKLCDTHKSVGGTGGQMPYDGEGIDETDMMDIGLWILAGAPE